MARTPQQRRDARHQQAPVSAAATVRTARRGPSGGTKKPITVDAIVEAAFDLIAQDGYDALTMRRLATALETGPASLYAHVVNKDDLGELLIGRLCTAIEIPAPDPSSWQLQVADVCARMRDQYVRYPGITRATLAIVPTNLETLRISEGLLALLLTGGADPRAAAWTADALSLYVNAYCLEITMRDARRNASPDTPPNARPDTRPDASPDALPEKRRRDGDSDVWGVDRDELLRRFTALPNTFPQTRRYAAELTSGVGHERFDFTVRLMINGLARA